MAYRCLQALTAALAITNLSAISPLAQEVPNLSGTWTLVPLTKEPHDAGFAPQGRKFTVVQDASTITITTTLNFGDSQTKRTYRLDGSETRQSVKTGPKETSAQTATAKWRDHTLVITTEWTFHKRTVTYLLDKTGGLIVTGSTTLLHKRDDQLTVSTTGPFTRAYRRDSK